MLGLKLNHVSKSGPRSIIGIYMSFDGKALHRGGGGAIFILFFHNTERNDVSSNIGGQ